LAVAVRGQGRQAGGGRGQVQLPDGAGKDFVSASCGSCHGLNVITGAAGYTQDGWRDLMATMILLPQEQAATVTQYLATHFPPKPGRAPVLVPGDATVTFREWMVPKTRQTHRSVGRGLQTPAQGVSRIVL
jgi:virginiamycin B lyase